MNIKGKSIDDRYYSYISNNGVIYFFYPQKLNRTDIIEKFSYDLTCLTKSDSATLNFTIVTKDLIEISRLSICNGENKSYIDNHSMLFRDVTKKGYETRITTRVAQSELIKIYKSNSVMSFILTFGDGTEDKVSYSKRKWKKDSAIFTKVFNSIY